MKGYLEYLKDVYNTNYLGIKIDGGIVEPFLNELKKQIGEQHELFVNNQKKRDLGSYHITVINNSEYNNLLKSKGIDKVVNSLESFFDKHLDFTLSGIGKAQKGNNKEYFIIVKSEDLLEIRKYYGLAEKDFIITLGFYPAEVHGVRKNILLPLRDPFLKLLSANYYNHNQSFDFLKDFEFFDYDKTKEIEVIKIEDSRATFRVEQNYFSVSLLGDNLGISAKWQDTIKKPILSDTIITRKLKNI